MEWVLQSPQIHSTFCNLGYVQTDGYHINDNCNAALEAILYNILTEDKYLRSYRRNISFGQNIKKDLIPLLINLKEEKSMELLIQILMHLTTPIECLFNVEDISRSDFGRHTVFEINNLLTATKAALTDQRATKVVMDFLKKNTESEKKKKMPIQQCYNIGNTLLFLRNILHIPEEVSNLSPSNTGTTHTVQNQILWNLFSQSIDKVLIKLMTIPDSGNWGVTMVQLIALLYKDQHVTTLHKLLNVWLETSISESSEDNESNTSPLARGRDDASPMITSDPTSDSSDTGIGGKGNDATKPITWENNTANENNDQSPSHEASDKISSDDCSSEDKKIDDNVNSNDNNSSESNASDDKSQFTPCNSEKKITITENSDCGYGTQLENQASISTSSNEEEAPTKKPFHQKPHTVKQNRVNNKARINNMTVQERKRKKIVRRGKSNIINVQGLTHKTPTDDDISNVLKEFTVDFLLKGFNSLVKTLHDQILSNQQVEIDTSHFFWLVTYFLKFATQIELDLEHVCSVLSFDIISYITAEGVNICEQFELAIKLDGNDLKPCIRRLHLAVTAIREFVQAIEAYKKSTHMSCEDQQLLLDLQLKMCETEEFRSLLVLLLRHYNPMYHSKQYLQDLIVTNHILLMFLESIMKLPEYKGSNTIVEHIKHFANPNMMYQYGLLLEDYEENGEFVNDCVFNVMHHVSGELGSLICLFQPIIIKTFTAISKSDFDICDDWSDLVEYVIKTFVKKTHICHNHVAACLEGDNFKEYIRATKANAVKANTSKAKVTSAAQRKMCIKNKSLTSNRTSRERWSDDEISSLSWNYIQCNTLPDMIGEIVKLFKENGITKSRESVTRQLLKQSLIPREQFEKLMHLNKEVDPSKHIPNNETIDGEIRKLCEQIAQDDKAKFLVWVQTVVLETCTAKIHLNKRAAGTNIVTPLVTEYDELREIKKSDLPALSPVSYHSLLFNQSVPLVPWNYEQSAMCKDLKFLQLLHKLGFHMPVDSGKVFIRIPQFWTADFLYEVASKISPIDTSKLKFSLSDISESSLQNYNHPFNYIMPGDLADDVHMNSPPENLYQVHKQQHLATAVNFTPRPGSFNYSTDQMNSSNWLQMVQRSQDFKLSLNRQGTKVTDADEDVDMEAMPEMIRSSNMGVSGICVTSLPDNILSVPTTMGIKQDDGVFSVQMDSEYCNNSICETASVASDLTRMYVSDEEDKPDELPVSPLVSPIASPLASPSVSPLVTTLEMSLHPTISDIRPRMQFSPTFLASRRNLPDY